MAEFIELTAADGFKFPAYEAHPSGTPKGALVVCGMTSPSEATRQPHYPVLAHFGEQDQSIPLAGVDAFKQAHPEVDVRTYEAGHGFSCDHRGAFNAVAAAQAREVTLKFFATHIG